MMQLPELANNAFGKCTPGQADLRHILAGLVWVSDTCCQIKNLIPPIDSYVLFFFICEDRT